MNTILLVLILFAVLLPEEKRNLWVKRISGAFFITLLGIGLLLLAWVAVWNYNVKKEEQEFSQPLPPISDDTTLTTPSDTGLPELNNSPNQ